MRLRPGLRAVAGPPFHLRAGDHDIVLFDGDVDPWLPRLLDLLDGRDRAAITRALPEADPGDVDHAIEELRRAGALEDDAAPRGRITLVGSSPLWPRLRDVVDAEIVEDGGLAVVHEETRSPSQMAELNRRQLASRRPWMTVSLQGPWARVGPLFVPGETCCWDCLRARMLSNRAQAEAWLAWEAADAPLATVSSPAQEATAAGFVAAELGRHFRRHAPKLAGRFLVMDLETLESDVESVAIAPYCPACRA